VDTKIVVDKKIVMDKKAVKIVLIGFMSSLVLLLSSCASDPGFVSSKAKVPFNFYIVNNTKSFVDIVKFKPCGAPEKYFRNAATKIGPKEQIMSKVYDVCIDLVAIDIFNRELARQQDYWMAQQAIWHIN